MLAVLLDIVAHLISAIASIAIKNMLSLRGIGVCLGFVLAAVLAIAIGAEIADRSVWPSPARWYLEHLDGTNQATPFAGAAREIESGTADSHQSIHSQSSAVLSQYNASIWLLP